MASAAIWIGLFILFAVAFVGGLGSAIYTYAACASAIALIAAGLLSFKAESRWTVFFLLGVSALVYVPVIFQRFTWRWGPDWGGLILDAMYVSFVLTFLYTRRPFARDSKISDA